MNGGVGAIVITHNSADDLPACLEALLAGEGVERIAVVDNVSRDDSRDIARSVGDSRIAVVEEPVNTGFAGGCNRGFRELASQYRYLAFLNPDVVVSRDCLSRCVEALEADAELAGVAPLLMRTDGETVDSAGQVLKSANLEVRDIGYGLPPSPDLLEARPVLAACGALAVFRTKALAAVADEHGPWAQQFFCFWEDLELGWRLANSGRVVSYRTGRGCDPPPRRWGCRGPRSSAVAQAGPPRGVYVHESLDDVDPAPPSP